MSNPPAHRETWTLRRQFVIPLGMLILVVAGLISLSTAWVNRKLEYRAVAERFDRVGDQLASANYPLSTSVLTQIRNYSGLDVILVADGPRVEASSLIVETSEAALSACDEQAIDASASSKTMQIIQVERFGSPVFTKFYPLSSQYRDDAIVGAMLLLPESDLGRQRFALVWAPAVTGMFSILLLMMVASWIGSKLAGRIELLESHVEQLTTSNYQSVDLPGPKDALFRLSQRINSLARQLAVAHDVIAKTERARLISMVASGLAHDIRNSIGGARLLIESVLRGQRDGDDPELPMALNELNKATASLKRILASDPNTTLTDESDMTLREISVALRQSLEHQAAHHQVTLTIQDPETERVIEQGTAMLTCLMNLAMNAIEAAGIGGHVEVQTWVGQNGPLSEKGAEHLVWKVWDDGPGPPESIAEDIAEPFVSSKREGVGLGLAMVKRVADQREGTLRWFRKQDRTCFEFSIRLFTRPATKPLIGS